MVANERDFATLRGGAHVYGGAQLAAVADNDTIPARVGAKAAEGVAAAAGPPMPRIPWAACHPVPIMGAIVLTAGAGTLDAADQYAPKDPYWWDLRDLSIWGFTAGTVTVFKNSTSGTQLAVTSVPGDFTWSAQKILGPRDRLIFVATGITGSVQFEGQAIEIETSWLPEYLM